MKNNNTNEYIQCLTDGVFLLAKKIEGENLNVASHLVDDFKNSLSKVRLNNDKLVDPDTVDSRIKALIAGLFGYEERKELKNNFSIRTIQEAYFK